MPQPYSYYTNNYYGYGSYPQNAQKLVEDAVWAADPYIDFSRYDNDNNGYVDALFIVHAGRGAESTGNVNDIWSHAWTTVNMPYVDGVYASSYGIEPEDGQIGVFGHELGHALFGLYDLYDLGFDSYGTGSWSMMSVGCWGGGGALPVHFDAWSKIRAGFAEAINVTSDELCVEIPQVEDSNVIYRLWSQGTIASQYFLVENRQQVGFDVSLPGSGLLIYHIDETRATNNDQWYPGYTFSGNYRVAIEQADGDWDLERNYNPGDAGDPWSLTNNAACFDVYGTPDSKDYGFQHTDVSISSITPSAAYMHADFEVGILVQSGQEITMTPASSNMVVPDEGGNIDYHLELMNHEAVSVQLQYWVTVTLQNGSTSGPLTGPAALNLPANNSIVIDFSQTVPGHAPAGEYRLTAYMGTYPAVVEDSASFSFRKGKYSYIGISNPQLDGWSSTGGFAQAELPTQLILHGAYPNPFNPTTAISYQLSAASFVKLTVHDVSGRKVADLVNGSHEAGVHEVTFDASNLASGIYLYRLTVDETSGSGATPTMMAGKMMLVK